MSKFKPLKKPFKDRVIYFLRGLLFWKGRDKGMVHTRDITWDDLRAVFFPRNFYERYKYLGSVPHSDEGSLYEAMLPLVITCDYIAKPWWCPRFFLRFLHLFGNDNSIVRIRNWQLYKLHRVITKGIMIWDYKTKWEWYDLRISVVGPEHIQHLADDIERGYYKRGEEEEIVERIRAIDPKASIIRGDNSRLWKQLEELKNGKSNNI